MKQGNFGIMRKNDKKFDNYRKNCKLIEIYCLQENMKNKNGLKKRQKWEKLIKKKNILKNVIVIKIFRYRKT